MNSEVETLVRSQHELYGRITRVIDNLKKMGAAKITPGAVSTRIKMLEGLWEKFEATHDTLRCEHWKIISTHEYTIDDFFQAAEESYLGQHSALSDLLEELRGKSIEPAVTPAATLAGRSTRDTLPRIQLTPFTGRIAEWPAFKALFRSVIDSDPSLSPAQKLYFLRTYVKDEAEEIIRDIPPTGENYARVWSMLTERYENKRLLVKACLSSFTALPKLKNESSADFKRLVHGTLQTMATLEGIGCPLGNCHLYIHLVVEKLDPRSRREWETSISGIMEPPSFEELKTFLECRLRTVEALHPDEASASSEKSVSASRAARSHLAQRAAKSARCSLCQKEHYILSCGEFQKKTADERKEFAEANQLCLNCFGKHRLKECPSRKSCVVCKKRHHSSLHDLYSKANQDGGPSTSLHARDAGGQRSVVLLATARVMAIDRYGKSIPIRALIDPGSEISIMTESLAQRLRLPRSAISTRVFGVGGQQTGTSRGGVAVELVSPVTNASIRVMAAILPSISIYGHRIGSTRDQWAHVRDLALADPTFRDSDSVDILLGADIYAMIVEEGLKKGAPSEPVAQRTSFGWILWGTVGHTQPRAHCTTHQCSANDNLDVLVRGFWEQEEPPRDRPQPSEDAQRCEEHFARTHQRLPDGRYMVRLPIATAWSSSNNSRRVAMRVLRGMERRFTADATLHTAYSRFMAEYEELRHMSRAPPLDKHESRACYLPHHGVFKTGASAKIRVVFNGSARLASGNSLNDKLVTGPNLLPALADVLLRWRRHRYALATDIEKMYRQIMVHPEDRDLQRILWRLSPDQPIQEYRLNTVTYGLTCALYLAIRTLRQLTDNERERYPLGATALRSDAYVDDVLTGADTLEQAGLLQSQLTKLCLAGGFPLKKWAANAEELLHVIPTRDRQHQGFREWEPETSHSTLGLRWHPRDDVFAFRVTKVENERATKRLILSEAARLFDPLGWLAPTVVLAKMLIQSLWQQRIEWDQPVSREDEQTWSRFRNELPTLEMLRIPRWLRVSSGASRVELHGFADASERAFAAVVYLVSRDGNRDRQVTLLQAKTRVAPLRPVSIPRLELCAAALLVRVMEHAKASLEIPLPEIHLWSDSMVALGWIRGHPSRWKTYVANRVADIQEALPEAVWHHVPGEENPADCASRGLLPGELVRHSLWWQGPTWLKSGERCPLDLSLESNERELPEQRAHTHIVTGPEEENPMLLRFSARHRLLRVTAWCRRWLRVLDTPVQISVSGPITPQELEEAERKWIVVVQGQWFSTERVAVARGEAVQRRSSLVKLSPFLDDHGLLRVGGRMKHAILSHDERHPIILPARSHFTALVIDAVHRRTLHGGVQLTLSTLRQRYWIPGGRRAVKSRIHHCVTCVRWRAASPSPLMGDLPPPRVNVSRAFTHTGVDYAGPVSLRAARGRGQRTLKGFMAIFVCLSTRAVHLELVSDYTTDAFLAALRRFVSRRGLCAAIYSDRGTNFVGADAELRRFLRNAARERRVADALANEGIEWKFNPPAAPHFGGIWEAAVKSTKHHLRRVLGETVLTFEELSTLLSQVEACLNSRPLFALSDDPEDLAALTPGHFLVGTALNAVPEPSLKEIATNRLTRWQLLQQMRDHFWERWSREYLQTLTQRSKWWKKDAKPSPGDLCLVKNETTPPTKWPLARIVAIYPGTDGQVRVVTVRTASSTLKRPVTKLVPLWPDENRNKEE